jgi:tripartite-type tricarboxylate transporter receptor subunit TctC
MRAMLRSAIVVLLTSLPGLAGHAQAQTWPTRPVTMVVPFAAGGPMDTVGRILTPRLTELLQQQVIVENIGGAGGMTGSARVARAAPDGYQFVLGNVGTHAVSQTLYKKALYRTAVDFEPVGLIADLSLVLIARKDLPADDLKSFIAYARANEAKMQFASAGAGSATHLGCALLNAAAGLNVTHVPYRGGAPAMQDLLAGQVDYLCIDTPVAIPQIRSEAVRGIAILSRDRSASLPSLATAREQGLADFEASNWSAFFLPKGTPATIVKWLNEATVATMNTPNVQGRLKEVGVDVVAPDRRSPQYHATFVESETAKWGAAIKATGVSAD